MYAAIIIYFMKIEINKNEYLYMYSHSHYMDAPTFHDCAESDIYIICIIIYDIPKSNTYFVYNSYNMP